jgi:hypothetical protein
MKVDVASCGVCQRVKAEHERLAGLLQSLEVPEWPWDDIAMPFVVGLPHTQRGKVAVWVIVNRLSKVSHFIPIHTIDSASDLAPIFVREIVRLHGVPKTITSDRDAKIVSKFWGSCQCALGTQLRPSTVFHPSQSIQSKHLKIVEVLCLFLARELGGSLATCGVCL